MVHGTATLEQLRTLLRDQGVRTAYLKLLSKRQDNSKNQIYLGGGLDGVTNLFPSRIEARSASASIGKRKSAAGQPKLEAQVDFAWLGVDGVRHEAPNTRIIDYFQYPEVRLSGFLKDCDAAPRSLDRDRQSEYGQRILVMGTSFDGKVLGVVLTERDDPLVGSFPDLPLLYGNTGVLRVLSIDAEAGIPPSELLHREISSIVRGGWYTSRINKGGNIVPFHGAQGGGYTLEALLGVAANGNKAPDRHGFEIKSYSGSRISLMTPTPDLGFQGTHTFREFMERWGRPGDKDDGSMRFVGLHRAGVTNDRTGLTLRLTGYDRIEDRFDDASSVAVELWHEDRQEVAAGWSLEKLANCWNAKHASALYIGFKRREGVDALAEYAYADRWLIGRGTDVWKLLRAIDRGLVFYDPADTIYHDNRAKVRSQWRINAAALADSMKLLYSRSEVITL